MLKSRNLLIVTLALLCSATVAYAQAKKEAAKPFNLGRAATPQEIAGWDIDVRPDGQGAPKGQGSVKQGEQIFLAKCAACHGEFGESAGRWPQLAGGAGSLASHDPVKSVGSYFGSASTVLDYIRRAMPYGDAQSLTDDELYAVTAFVLNLNDIVDEKFVLSKDTLATVRMPNAAGFFEDDREKSERAFWDSKPCMSNCKADVKITGHATVIDVTPQDKTSRKAD
jgi:cytochrome c